MKISNFPVIDAAYFGGNQSWFENELRRKDGCGPVCAANILATYARRSNQEIMGFDLTSLDKKTYTSYMDKVYSLISPIHIWNPIAEDITVGMPLFGVFLKKLRVNMVLMGFDVRYRSKRKRDGFIANRHFIKKYNEMNLPIAVLVIMNNDLKRYNNHYMTITDYDEEGGTEYITVSTWGTEERIDLRRLWKGSRIFRVGVFIPE